MQLSDLISAIALVVAGASAAIQFWPTLFPARVRFVSPGYTLLRPPEENAGLILGKILEDDVRHNKTPTGQALNAVVRANCGGVFPTDAAVLTQVLKSYLATQPSFTYDPPLEMFAAVMGISPATVPIVLSTSWINRSPRPVVIIDLVLRLKQDDVELIYTPMALVDFMVLLRNTSAQFRDFMSARFSPVYVAPASVEYRDILFVRTKAFDSTGHETAREITAGTLKLTVEFSTGDTDYKVGQKDIMIEENKLCEVLKGAIVNNSHSDIFERIVAEKAPR